MRATARRPPAPVKAAPLSHPRTLAVPRPARARRRPWSRAATGRRPRLADMEPDRRKTNTTRSTATPSRISSDNPRRQPSTGALPSMVARAGRHGCPPPALSPSSSVQGEQPHVFPSVSSPFSPSYPSSRPPGRRRRHPPAPPPPCSPLDRSRG
jgi:hypothetical protein